MLCLLPATCCDTPWVHGSPDQARGLYCLYLPAAARCMVVVVAPAAAAADDVTRGVLDRAWRDARAALGAEGAEVGVQAFAT